MALVSETSAIQSLLDDLIKQEETKATEIKTQLDTLAKHMAENHLDTPGMADVEFGDEVVLQIGTGKFAKTIKSSATFSDFVAFVRFQLGTSEDDVPCFRDDQGRSVWLRTNHDIHHMFRWYFAADLPNLQIVSAPKADIDHLAKFNFRKEVMQRDGCAVFRCESAGPDGPLTFLLIPSSLNRNDGFSYLKQIYGQFTSIMFVDEAEDIITIDSDESWEYFIETGVSTSRLGHYQLLLIQFV